MAEELDLIEELDYAVFERASEELDGHNKLRLAVNISGRTITSPAFIKKVTTLAKAKHSWTGRMMFELTESAHIDDLALADKHIQVLREHGCLVCLDDFGAGAASLAYLQQLRLDVVKIDGRYIRELQHGKREATFIRHLVQMCGDLGVRRWPRWWKRLRSRTPCAAPASTSARASSTAQPPMFPRRRSPAPERPWPPARSPLAAEAQSRPGAEPTRRLRRWLADPFTRWKLSTREPLTRRQPSTSTKKISLNGRLTTTGGSIIIPMLINTLATTRSITRTARTAGSRSRMRASARRS